MSIINLPYRRQRILRVLMGQQQRTKPAHVDQAYASVRQDFNEETAIFGQVGDMISGRLRYHAEVHGRALTCPYCGGDEVELCNTHTPFYRVTCACGASVPGRNPADSGTTIKDFRTFERIHSAGIADAIRRWNRRRG